MARPRSDIRPRIVHAARELFLSDGVDGSSLRSIAKAAQTSVGMIYYYFPTKDDLFLAVVDEIYDGFLTDLSSALAPGAPVEERLRRVSERIGLCSDVELDVVRLVLREALVSSTRLGRVLDRFRHGHLALLLEALVEGIGAGEIDSSHPTIVLLISTFALIAVPQLARRFVGETPPFNGAPSGSELASALVTILLRGIAAQTPQPAGAGDITEGP